MPGLAVRPSGSGRTGVLTFGKADFANKTNLHHVYDPATVTWQSGAPLPTPRSCVAGRGSSECDASFGTRTVKRANCFMRVKCGGSLERRWSGRKGAQIRNSGYERFCFTNTDSGMILFVRRVAQKVLLDGSTRNFIGHTGSPKILGPLVGDWELRSTHLFEES